MISVGYILVQLLLFWIPHAIYLNEALILSMEIDGQADFSPKQMSIK